MRMTYVRLGRLCIAHEVSQMTHLHPLWPRYPLPYNKIMS